MNRRALLQRFVAVAAAFVVAPKVGVAEAAPSEADEIKAILANPDAYPEIMARVRELTGAGVPVFMSGAPDWEIGYYLKPDPIVPVVAYLDGPNAPIRIAPGTIEAVHGRMCPLTFEEMQADCAALGCRLRLKADGWTEHHMEIPGGILRSYFEHWDEDHQGQGPTDRIARLDAWRRFLHGEG